MLRLACASVSLAGRQALAVSAHTASRSFMNRSIIGAGLAIQQQHLPHAPATIESVTCRLSRMYATDGKKKKKKKKKADEPNLFAMNKRKKAAMDRRSARMIELGQIEDPNKRVVNTDFRPEFLKTDVLRAVTLEEMHRREIERTIPRFYAGSVLKVTTEANDGATREYIGICIAKSNKLLGSNFTIRNSQNGVGYEVLFQSYSPKIKSIEVLELARRRRAKLYYLRDRPLKESTISPRFQPVPISDVVPVKKAVKKKRKKPRVAKVRKNLPKFGEHATV